MTLLIKVENGQPVDNPILLENFRQLFSNVSFPGLVDNDVCAPYGYELYDHSPEPECNWDQKLVKGTPYKDDKGQWRENWIVVDLDGEELADALENRRRYMVAMVTQERTRRVSAGFDYDFGDSRGVHRIGTTPMDMVGWGKVSQLATAACLAGAPNTPVNIKTDTGAVTVTAGEWQQILIAAGQFEQPFWHKSFALQEMDPIPENYADDVYWVDEE